MQSTKFGILCGDVFNYFLFRFIQISRRFFFPLETRAFEVGDYVAYALPL